MAQRPLQRRTRQAVIIPALFLHGTDAVLTVFGICIAITHQERCAQRKICLHHEVLRQRLLLSLRHIDTLCVHPTQPASDICCLMKIICHHADILDTNPAEPLGCQGPDSETAGQVFCQFFQGSEQPGSQGFLLPTQCSQQTELPLGTALHSLEIILGTFNGRACIGIQGHTITIDYFCLFQHDIHDIQGALKARIAAPVPLAVFILPTFVNLAAKLLRYSRLLGIEGIQPFPQHPRQGCAGNQRLLLAIAQHELINLAPELCRRLPAADEQGGKQLQAPGQTDFMRNLRHFLLGHRHPSFLLSAARLRA